jgi:two-component system, NtrC family, response regulator AtoC
MESRILTVEDDASARAAIVRVSHSLGVECEVADSAARALEALSSRPFDLCEVSLGLPADAIRRILATAQSRKVLLPVVARAASTEVKDIVSAFRLGVVDFLPRAFHDRVCADVIRRVLAERGRASTARTSGVVLVGDHPAMHVVLERVDQVADSSASVLIRGEEGTGKEVVARLIHACGARSAGPFVTLRLAAGEQDEGPSNLRFGPAPANDGPGTTPDKLLEAEHATLFIDEIAKLPRDFQVSLLRLVRDPDLRTRADVRIIAATTRNLETAVREGTFIEDLYYRLNIIPIEMPPLRERVEDIPILVEHFRRTTNALLGTTTPPFPPDVLVRLSECPWPGNVRQLKGVVDRLVISAKDRGVAVSDLPASLRTDVKSLGKDIVDLPPHGVDLRLLLTQLETRLIGQALERTRGNKNRAAELLGMNRTTLVEKLRRRTVA